MNRQPISRLVAIGDIHGQAEKLDRLLEKISPTANDQLVFLGDYIDRGPDSRGVIERLLLLQAEFPHTIFLRGNHDQMLLDALVEVGLRSAPRLRDLSPIFKAESSGSDCRIFWGNGGRSTLRSYGLDNVAVGIPQNHIDFLAATQLLWRYKNFLFVHAGLAEGRSDEEQDLNTLLWERYSPLGQNGEIHVVGHHPTMNGEPLFETRRYSLDTGVAYGRPLTACNVLNREIWQVNRVA